MLCIAGKNSIAINCLKYLGDLMPKERILCMPNNEDTGVNLYQPSFRKFAQLNNYTIVNIEDITCIKNLIFISLESSRLLKLNNFSSRKFFNIHFSLLPKYRGMYTSAHPILCDEKLSGVTLHLIDEGIDTGPIIDQISFPLEDDLCAEDLYERYLHYGELLFKKNIHSLLDGSYASVPQNQSIGSYFSNKSIDYKNLQINFYGSAKDIKNQFRAYTFRNFQLPRFLGYEISRTIVLPANSLGEPGSVVQECENYFIVNTADYQIKLFKDFYTQFWSAVIDGNLQTTIDLISKVSEIDKFDPQGHNALMHAILGQNLDIILELIRSGANPFVENLSGLSPFKVALTIDQDDVLKFCRFIIFALNETGMLSKYSTCILKLMSHPQFQFLLASNEFQSTNSI